jgi:hypothetical protein
MELLVRHVLLLREFTPQIEINSTLQALSGSSPGRLLTESNTNLTFDLRQLRLEDP